MATNVDGTASPVGELTRLSSIDRRNDIILVPIFDRIFEVARIDRARIGLVGIPQSLIEPGCNVTALDNTGSRSRVMNLEGRDFRRLRSEVRSSGPMVVQLRSRSAEAGVQLLAGVVGPSGGHCAVLGTLWAGL